jgi:alpha-ketoglutarate-dependent taurine dioxygenase
LGDRVIERLKTAIDFQSLNRPLSQLLNEVSMYHYDPNTALEELTEDATLPNPVHVRDMILRKHPSTDKALELNRLFVEYQKVFGEAQKLGKEILRQLAG